MSSCRWAAAAVLAVVVSSASAVEIVPPEIGATEITVTGLTVPRPPGDPDKAIARGEAWAVLGHLAMQATHPAFRIYYIIGTEAIASVALQDPVSAADWFFVLDVWVSAYASTRVGGKTSDVLPEISGFEAGSPEITISGLPVGGELRLVSSVPGRFSTTRFVWEGTPTDLDGVADGVLVTSAAHSPGPPHVLPGELLAVVAMEEPSSVTVFKAGGEEVRHVVPAASHVIGASGIPFISDLAIANSSGLTADGWVRFVSEGTSFDAAPSADFHLEPGESTSWTDVLRTALGVTANVKGTLVIGGLPNWLLSATSRNYAVDAAGRRFGIAVPAEATLTPVAGPNPWIIPGLVHGGDLRANLILAGAVPQTSPVTIKLFSGGDLVGETTRDVPGYGLLQINRVAEALGAGTIDDGYVQLEVGSGAVFAGLSVVDGSADDAAYIPAEPMFR